MDDSFASPSLVRRHPLPTRAQIEAITTAATLDDIRDEIGRVIAKIETDLEYGDGDDEWAARARSALAVHRHTNKLIGHRLQALRTRATPSPFHAVAAVKTSRRSRSDCNPIGLELMEGELPDPAALATVAAVDEASKWLVERIEALTCDREDEVMNYDAVARDEAFMMRSNSTLRRAGACRMALLTRGAELRKAEKTKVQARLDATRPQMFVDCAREVLDRETFLAIWQAVDRRAPAGDGDTSSSIAEGPTGPGTTNKCPPHPPSAP